MKASVQGDGKGTPISVLYRRSVQLNEEQPNLSAAQGLTEATPASADEKLEFNLIGQ